jgi:hypothetical protein
VHVSSPDKYVNLVSESIHEFKHMVENDEDATTMADKGNARLGPIYVKTAEDSKVVGEIVRS